MEGRRRFPQAGRKKPEVPAVEFRRACRAYADKWIPLQSEEFKRLGIEGDWDNYYSTMSFEAEAAIAAEFLRVVRTGLVYRGSKPVMWSPVERHVAGGSGSGVRGEDEPDDLGEVSDALASKARGGRVRREVARIATARVIVIWTTTPWTIPGNRAISYSPSTSRTACMKSKQVEQGLAFEPWVKVGDRLILADKLAEDVSACAKACVAGRRIDDDVRSGWRLVCAHPSPWQEATTSTFRCSLAITSPTMRARASCTRRRATARTTLSIWVKNFGQEGIPFTVDEDGRFTKDAPGFEGLEILQLEGKNLGKDGPANKAVMDALKGEVWGAITVASRTGRCHGPLNAGSMTSQGSSRPP